MKKRRLKLLCYGPIVINKLKFKNNTCKELISLPVSVDQILIVLSKDALAINFVLREKQTLVTSSE